MAFVAVTEIAFRFAIAVTPALEVTVNGISTVNSPGVTKLITPPQMHVSVETLSRAGALPSSTVGAPGTHGAGVAGMHGMGVSTPIAAEVAAATVGLDGDMHIPKGMIFVIGM